LLKNIGYHILQALDNQFIKYIFEKFMKAIPDSEPDSLWKDLVEEFHEEFILFFFGKALYDEIDFSVPPEFLEKEFNDVYVGNLPRNKAADKIFRYKLKNGSSKFIIFHTEFQGKGEKSFAERMYEYYSYIVVKNKTFDITALAIYTGASLPKHYKFFKIEHFGTKLLYIWHPSRCSLQFFEKE
jgi:hypothetical protein